MDTTIAELVEAGKRIREAQIASHAAGKEIAARIGRQRPAQHEAGGEHDQAAAARP